jgi:hypothetical protein
MMPHSGIVMWAALMVVLKWGCKLRGAKLFPSVVKVLGSTDGVPVSFGFSFSPFPHDKAERNGWS